jgi:hypothetical protein
MKIAQTRQQNEKSKIPKERPNGKFEHIAGSVLEGVRDVALIHYPSSTD